MDANDTPLAQRVGAELEAARTRHAASRDTVAQLTLDEIQGVKGATAQLSTARKELQSTADEIARLESALALAERQKLDSRLASEAAARQRQLDQLIKLADARSDAAKALATSIEAVARAYDEFQKSTDALAIAMPLGVVPHAVHFGMIGIATDGVELPLPVHLAIGADFFRLGVPEGICGSKAPTINTRHRPQAIASLTEGVKNQNIWLCEELRKGFARQTANDLKGLAA